MNTFLLGLSVGGGCLTHCGPVLLPMLLCEERRRWRLAAAFLAARLGGYVLVALMIYLVGRMADGAGFSFKSPLVEGILFVLLGLYLIRYSLNVKREGCGTGACAADNKAAFGRFRNGGMRFAAQTGFLTGLGYCAPMIALVAEGIQKSSLAGTVGSFLSFYLGTTAILVPLFIGGFACGGRTATIRQIGFLCGMAAAALYLFQGLYLLTMEVVYGCF